MFETLMISFKLTWRW